MIVETTEGERSIYKTVCSGGSFGAAPLRQEIGLGQAKSIRALEIFWPVTGQTQVLKGMAMDHFHKVREGETASVVWNLECGNGRETLKAIQDKRPDIVFLDVRTPELDGFDVIRSLSVDRLPVIVFVTAHDQYALRAFEVYVADYLLKPFDRERFQKALCRARQTAQQGSEHRAVEDVSNLLPALQARPKPVERLAIKSAGRIQFVKPGEIDWIRGANNYTELHVAKTVHLLRQTLGALERQLLPNRFMRISRSLIVNIGAYQKTPA